MRGYKMPDQPDRDHFLALTAKIVSAHAAHNSVTPDGLTALITSVFQTLTTVGTVQPESEKQEPAVPVRKSVFPDRIICLDCGKKFSMIKRHLQTDHQMTPDAYRSKWGLARDYPMVAPDYAAKRSALARSIGLGRRRGESVVAAAPAKATAKTVQSKAGAKFAMGAKPKKVPASSKAK
jgi:predicted transcriptional regulator